MRFTYHIGMHCTDEDRAVQCLLRNGKKLTEAGTIIARPGRFRPVLREAMVGLKGATAPADLQERILDAVTDADAPHHILFSSDSFLCVPMRAIAGGSLYPLVGERAPWIRNLFPQAPAHFCLALRNPATLIPALQARFSAELDFQSYLERIEPEELSWTDMVTRLRAAVPDARITVWCNEDAPLLWPDLLALLSGQPAGTVFRHQQDFLNELMVTEGVDRLTDYLERNPPRNPDHRRKVTAAFLDKFAIADAIEETFDLPGWDSDRIVRLTDTYLADIAQVRRLDGIEFIAP